MKKKEELEDCILSDLSVLNKEMPCSEEAEDGIISCMFQNPDDFIPKIIELNKSDLISNETTRIIYDACIAMYNKNIPINPVTITHFLRDSKKLDKVGGPARISELFAFVPIPSNFPYYLKILQDKLLLRVLIRKSSRIMFCAQRADINQVNVDQIISDAEDDILSIKEGVNTDFKHIKDSALDAIDDIQFSIENPGVYCGLATGFKGLDYLTTGLKGGELFIIAARASTGKTSLAMNMVEHMAIRDNKHVAIFSLEMQAKMLTKGLLCRMSGLSMHAISTGLMTNGQQQAMAVALRRIQQSNIFIDDTSAIDISVIKAKSRRLHKLNKLQCIFVDYLQLATYSATKVNREGEVAKISSGLKDLAKELDIPVIALAQLNRNVENRKEKRPMLSDLRESGSIEQDADLVGLLTRTGYFGNKQQSEDEVIDEGEAMLILAKNRNGPTDDVPLRFNKELMLFTEPNK